MNDDDVKLSVWVVCCCILGALAVILATMAVRGCA